MVGFEYKTKLTLGQSYLSGITDLKIGPNGILYAGSEHTDGVTTWSLGEGTVAQHVASLEFAPWVGSRGLSDIEVTTIKEHTVLVPSGRYDDKMAYHRLDGSGLFESTKILSAPTQIVGHINKSIFLKFGAKTYFLASQQGVTGFKTFQVRDDLTMKYKRHVTDNTKARIDDIDDMTAASLAGRQFVFMTSAAEDGVTAFWVQRWGNVKERGSASPETGLYIDKPVALATATLDGKLYVIVAAAGSGSLSTLQVGAWGQLTPVDHVLDSLETRFDGVTALSVVTLNDRAFVIAGGADDGISLFELSADGKLHHMSSIADQHGTTLNNISAITATVVGSEIQVFVSSSAEQGITQFTLDLNNLGTQITGTRNKDILRGTDQDDLLVGYAGHDHLFGGRGDDRLIDGKGVDRLTGGEGADTFVFKKDRRLDRIEDFEISVDKIDLSDFKGLHSIDQITFAKRDYGVLLKYADDRLAVEAADGRLLVSDFSADDFIFA